METSSRDRYALVTGAGSGLGRAFCLRLVSEGYTVAAADIDLSAANATQAKIETSGGNSVAVQLDVSDIRAWQAVRERLRTDWPRLDLLVNNAGVCVAGEIGQVPLDDFRRAMEINFYGALNGCHTMVEWMREPPTGGYVINVASVFGLAAPPALGAYNVSKAAVVALSETLYGELRSQGIGVTVVAPGFFSSRLVADGRYSTQAQRRIAERYADRASVTAEEVVAAALDGANRGRLYVVHGSRVRWTWRLKRWFPALCAKLVTWKYHRQLRKYESTD